jgi:hypothetical protein
MTIRGIIGINQEGRERAKCIKSTGLSLFNLFLLGHLRRIEFVDLPDAFFAEELVFEDVEVHHATGDA